MLKLLNSRLFKMVSKMDRSGLKKSRTKKDPNAPKKARTAYIIFSTEEGKRVREANPEMSAIEVVKELGRRWGTLEAPKKSGYEERAAVDRERYNDEMESYSPPASPEYGSAKKGKRVKDPNAPKRPVSAYLSFFTVENKKVRAANPTLSVSDVMKETAARWTRLDNKARQPWEEKAAADKQRYVNELAVYNEA